MVRVLVLLAICAASIGEACAQYTGTAHVSRGTAVPVESNIYICDKGRRADVGRATTLEGQEYLVPASTAWFDARMPWASDLHNVCTGKNYTSYHQALAALDGTDIVTVDSDGEVITIYMFVDNYADVYINGVPVGKDRVPFTQFNSSIIRVRVARPFTIAIRAVDWEEQLGIGVELNGGDAFHAGDGGLVAVLTDSTDAVIGATDASWKAQTFYTAPIVDLSCPTEQGSVRSSSSCATSNIGSYPTIYALHWPVPDAWMEESFDDSDWPSATTYTPSDIGVMNKPAYTNFTAVFERAPSISFVWSTNLILDNEVLLRKRIDAVTSVDDVQDMGQLVVTYDDVQECVVLRSQGVDVPQRRYRVSVLDSRGSVVLQSEMHAAAVSLSHCSPGLYAIRVEYGDHIRCMSIIR